MAMVLTEWVGAWSFDLEWDKAGGSVLAIVMVFHLVKLMTLARRR